MRKTQYIIEKANDCSGNWFVRGESLCILAIAHTRAEVREIKRQLEKGVSPFVSSRHTCPGCGSKTVSMGMRWSATAKGLKIKA